MLQVVPGSEYQRGERSKPLEAQAFLMHVPCKVTQCLKHGNFCFIVADVGGMPADKVPLNKDAER